MCFLKIDARGFTLVEISIVLVIIGLLTGGILTGRDLIRASKVKAQITQIDSYRSATNAFYAKYGYLPGDMLPKPAATFGFISRTGVCGSGDGNEILQGPGYGCVGHTPGGGEQAMFWVDLSTANYIDGSFIAAGATVPWGTADIAVNTAGGGIGLYFPKAKIGSGDYVYIWSAGSIVSGTYYSGNANYYGIAEVTQIHNYTDNGKIASSTNLPVSLAYMLDAKVDDGLPITGKVIAMFVSNDPIWADNSTNSLYNAPPTQTARSSTSCFDNNNVAGATEQYSTTVNSGNGANCAISFQF